MKTTPKKREESSNPIEINKNVWFYPTEKRFEFTVWIGDKVTLFELPFRKIKKYIK